MKRTIKSFLVEAFGRHVAVVTWLPAILITVAAPAGVNADSLLLWNKLGSETEITHSEVGPNLAFYPGGSWPEVKATPGYVPGVFGGALTIAPGGYGVLDRLHNVVLNNVNTLLNPNRGTIEFWYRQVQDPVAYESGIYRMFDGSFGLGSGFYFESHAYVGLSFGLSLGGHGTSVTNDIKPFTGTWIHLAGVWDVSGIGGTTDKLRLYVNGDVVASSVLAEWSGGTFGSAADICGGQDYAAGRFAMDNLKIFDYAKTNFADRFREDGHLVEVHPADTNLDSRLEINEITAYGAAWKTGQTWHAAPNPIPIDYVTRAGYLWKVGETYRNDGGAAPGCWVPEP
jgi:hypothetical protein